MSVNIEEKEKKEILYDDVGRKIKTEHYSKAGVHLYDNEYDYQGDSQDPSRGRQTWFDPNSGEPFLRKTFSINAQKGGLMMTKLETFDKGEKKSSTYFDPQTGLRTMEHLYSHTESDFLVGEEIIYKDDIVQKRDSKVFLAGSWYSKEALPEELRKRVYGKEKPSSLKGSLRDSVKKEEKTNVIANAMARKKTH